MSARPNIKDQIAAKRAEAAKSTPQRRAHDAKSTASALRKRAPAEGGDGMLEDRTVEGQIRSAHKSGKLDISSLDLSRIPAAVYTDHLGIPPDSLTRPPSPKVAQSDVKGMTRSFSSNVRLAEGAEKEDVFGKGRKEQGWVEGEELTVFKAGGNGIDRVEAEIGAFGGLKSIDLSGNRIPSLPNTCADLLRLTVVDLSSNALTTIPPSLLLLPALQTLDLSHNSISAADLSDPVCPSDEGLAYGAGFLSTSFSRATTSLRPVWPALRSLSLAYNSLTNESLAGLRECQLRTLRVLRLEGNRLRGELDLEAIGIGERDCPELLNLVLSNNLGLKGTKGGFSPIAKVEMEGCDLPGEAGSSFAPRPTPSNTKVSDKPKSDLPVPLPDMTVTYITHPAATFESDPLAVDFDLYLPTRPAGPSGHPLVIWFHGGGLLQGNKENLPPHFRRLPGHTYDQGGKEESVAIMSPNYRLAPQVPILDIFSDITALMRFVRTKLNETLKTDGQAGHVVDVNRICLSGGSAGGYLALMAGLEVPRDVSEEEVGGYRGEGGKASGIKCIAPFYAITDLTDKFWATETNPAPGHSKSIPHQAAKSHLDLKAAPIATSVSDGPRSILYPYMLQHGLFPSLLFLRQKTISVGREIFRPGPLGLSIPHRLDLCAKRGVGHVPVYFSYGTADRAVQDMGKTLAAFEKTQGAFEAERREGTDHGFDEDPGEECLEFREWLGKNLL